MENTLVEIKKMHTELLVSQEEIPLKVGVIHPIESTLVSMNKINTMKLYWKIFKAASIDAYDYQTNGEILIFELLKEKLANGVSLYDVLQIQEYAKDDNDFGTLLLKAMLETCGLGPDYDMEKYIPREWEIENDYEHLERRLHNLRKQYDYEEIKSGMIEGLISLATEGI